MRYLLENLGYELVAAENRDEAMAALDQGPFAVAIVDYFLRNIPAAGLIGELRRRYPSMPLICSTAARPDEIKLGDDVPRPDAFLFKPFEAKELRDLLASLVG